MFVDIEAWHDNQEYVAKEAYKQLWYNLYQKAPMLSPDLSYMRYSEGILKGGNYHGAYYNAKYNGAKPNSGGSIKSSGKTLLPYNGTGPDPRVNELPGLDERVKNPVTKQQGLLRHVIIELNDRHKWTREAIADWLDSLDIDLRFKTKEEENEQD
jgi:hypothetical protein